MSGVGFVPNVFQNVSGHSRLPLAELDANLEYVSGKNVTVIDFAAVGDGVTNDTAAFVSALASSAALIQIPDGSYNITSAIVPAGKALLSERAQFTLATNGVLTDGGTNLYAQSLFAVDNQPLVADSGALFIQFLDKDTTGTLHGNGLVVDTYGDITATGARKDIHGVISRASVNTVGSTTKGCSAFIGLAYQYGTGVATNEFHTYNPAGSAGKATQMVACEAGILADMGNSDGSHFYDVFQAVNEGTGDLRAAFQVTQLSTGRFINGLDLSNANITDSAVKLANDDWIKSLTSGGTSSGLIRLTSSDLIELGTYLGACALYKNTALSGLNNAGTIQQPLLKYNASDVVEVGEVLFLNPATDAAFFQGSVQATTGVYAYSGTDVPAGGTAGVGFTFTTTPNLGIFVGSGVPTLSAAQGSLYVRTDGSSTSTRLYVNTNGTTGWTNVTTAT